MKRYVSEADVRRLHERLEWARQNFRPSDGFLLDRPVEKLPSAPGRRYSARPTRPGNKA